jgi:hypothetical protein
MDIRESELPASARRLRSLHAIMKKLLLLSTMMGEGRIGVLFLLF